MARAVLKGYKGILDGTTPAPKQSEVLSTTTDKEKIALRKANLLAYSKLLMSMEEEVAFCEVETAGTTDLPKGSAQKAWDNLKAKYEANTGASYMMVKREFQASKLEPHDRNPEEWIAELERLRGRLADMGHPVSDDDMIIQVLNSLPSSYMSTVEQLDIELDDKAKKSLETAKTQTPR